MKRRRRRYKSNFTHAQESDSYRIMIPILCLLGALLLAVVIGLLLRNVAEGDSADEGLPDHIKDVSGVTFKGEVTPTPNAFSIYLTAEALNGSLTPALDEIRSAGYDSVTLMLRDGGGEVTFVSEAERALRPDTPMEGRMDLSSVTERMKEKELRVSGIFNCTAYAYTGATGAAYEALERALIKEAGLCGVDEILILGLPVDPISSDRVFAFLSSVRAETQATVCAVLPYTFLAEPSAAEYVTYLSRCVDAISVDLSGFAPDEEKTYAICEYLDSVNIIYYLERYNIRVLLPAELADQVSVLKAAGYRNIGLIN